MLDIFLQPKPILIEKQFSEPNSPITKSFEPSIEQEMQQHQSNSQESYTDQHSQHQQHKRPPMHRGYSDLGNRIKKRVTLR